MKFASFMGMSHKGENHFLLIGVCFGIGILYLIHLTGLNPLATAPHIQTTVETTKSNSYKVVVQSQVSQHPEQVQVVEITSNHQSTGLPTKELKNEITPLVVELENEICSSKKSPLKQEEALVQLMHKTARHLIKNAPKNDIEELTADTEMFDESGFEVVTSEKFEAAKKGSALEQKLKTLSQLTYTGYWLLKSEASSKDHIEKQEVACGDIVNGLLSLQTNKISSEKANQLVEKSTSIVSELIEDKNFILKDYSQEAPVLRVMQSVDNNEIAELEVSWLNNQLFADEGAVEALN